MSKALASTGRLGQGLVLLTATWCALGARPGEATSGPPFRAVCTVAKVTGVEAVALSPDGRRLVTAAGDGVATWDASTGQRLPGGDRDATGCTRLAYAPDGRLVAGAIVAPLGVVLLNTRTWRRVRTIPGQPQEGLLAWLAGWWYPPEGCPTHTDTVTCLAFSPDARWLATGSRDGTVRVWEVTTGRARGVLLGHGEAVRGMTWAPDGGRLVSHSYKAIIQWDARTMRPLTQWRDIPTLIHAVALSPDGRHVAYGTTAKQLFTRDLATGQLFGPQERGGLLNLDLPMVYAPDGQALTATWSTELLTWQGASAYRPTYQKAHASRLVDLAMSRDGGRLATAGRDGVVKVWATGWRPAAPGPGPANPAGPRR
ncbi:MAG: hypothetical protein VKS61_18185 [Candidatus Sericytochromatia bacterium]|nr:hypothetical protein [Candidatus Sericytochromatia bacterium]